MLEIWYALCLIMKSEEDGELEKSTLYQEFKLHLRDCLLHRAFTECVSLLGRSGNDYEPIGKAESKELYDWLSGYENNIINAYVDLLLAQEAGNVDLVLKNLRPTTRLILSTFLNKVEEVEFYRQEEVRYFIRVAKATGVKWDQKNNRFVP